ncbi:MULTISPECIES: molecular chaperone DjiA [Rhodobacterales]|uniref:molecular chaperone DjiA n=1 Tax=Roseobacter sp. N2S TaxID=2663844 RepID=UPI00285F6460|nr:MULTISPECIES: molecular chaperone DjiA [Rhodobacterales]MDR6265267.1 DnaJ like chaperone protein [Roseobacter sp. N2S]
MSIWTRIAEALSALTKGESLAHVFERLKTPPERSVAFTIAVIALGAKMAKADGLVTKDEVAAFRQVFQIHKRDELQAARVYNLARQDVAGYEVYAGTIAKMFRHDSATLENLIEGLFYIAMADGQYHPSENDFIHSVATIFGISERSFHSLRAQFVPDATPDAYDVLGVTPDTPFEDIRKAWRAKIRDTHPDRLLARGLPEEAISLATKHMIAVNLAWETLSEKHAPD